MENINAECHGYDQTLVNLCGRISQECNGYKQKLVNHCRRISQGSNLYRSLTDSFTEIHKCLLIFIALCTNISNVCAGWLIYFMPFSLAVLHFHQCFHRLCRLANSLYACRLANSLYALLFSSSPFSPMFPSLVPVG